MQLEAADWSIQATPPVHLQGFTPTCVQYWKAANSTAQQFFSTSTFTLLGLVEIAALSKAFCWFTGEIESSTTS